MIFKFFKADSLFTKPYKEVEPVNIKNLTEYDYEDNISSYDEDLQQYIKEIELEERRHKIASCLLLIKNLLNSSPNKVSDTVKNSKLDKEKTFDKIYAEMLNFCVSTIDLEVSNKILDDNSIDMVDELSVNKYLKFEAKKFLIIGPEPKLTQEEENLIKELDQLSENPEIYNTPIVSNEDFSISEFSFFKGRGFYVSLGSIIGFSVTLSLLLIKRK
jgi:hypothetical protein